MRGSLAVELSRLITIESFIMEQERLHAPEASGDLSNVLYDIALGTKLVAAAIQEAIEPASLIPSSRIAPSVASL